MLEIIKLREKLGGRFACDLHETPVIPALQFEAFSEMLLVLICMSSLTSNPCTAFTADGLFLSSSPLHLASLLPDALLILHPSQKSSFMSCFP